MTSFVAWLAELDLTIHTAGDSRFPLSPTARDGILDTLHLKGVLTLACELPGDYSEIPLRTGQCWLVPWLDTPGAPSSVYKILSFVEDDDPDQQRLHLLEWIGDGSCPSPHNPK